MVKEEEKNVEDRISTLYNFYNIVKDKPKHLPLYEIMVTGYAIKNNLPRKFVVDTLYYMSQTKGR